MNKLKVNILLGVMCMLLTIGIAVQIKTVKSISTSVGKTQTENELRDSVLRWQEKYKKIYDEEVEKETELEALRQSASNQSSNSVNLSSDLEKFDILLGYTDVSRSGISYHFERCKFIKCCW